MISCLLRGMLINLWKAKTDAVWMCLELNKIYLMNCRRGLKELGRDFTDITITSPPYNLRGAVRGDKYKAYTDDLPDHAYFSFIEDTIIELLRVTKYYVFFNFQILSNNKLVYLELMSKYKKNIKDIIIWSKPARNPSIQPTCLTSVFEFVVVFSNERYANKRTFERAFFDNRNDTELNCNLFHAKRAAQEDVNLRGHELNTAMFSEEFVKWFLDKFTKEDDIVLDPFMGLGTTAVVCKKMKRNFIGFEIDKESVDFANDRLENTQIDPKTEPKWDVIF